MVYDVPPALGAVVEEDRGSLPFALVHGEALVACAAWALGEAGVTALDSGTPWSAVVASAEPLVLHDALCPLTPPDFIADCLLRAVEDECVVVGVRPVTDTVKVVAEGLVRETVDRDSLVSVGSPIVLPPTVVATLEDWPGSDFAALVADLRGRVRVELVEAPPSGRRVGSLEDVAVLEALTSGEQPGPGPRGR